jgi:hypothetical protein
MTSKRTLQVAAAVLILGTALLAGTWGYNQTWQPEQADSTEKSPDPVYPAGYSPVQIDHPPQCQDTATKQAAGTTEKTPDPLSQVWEFNAQQPPQLLAQPLTDPNWYITGVVQQGDNTRVMVQFQGESQVRFYKIGDTLPGGSKLAWVKPGAIGVVTTKRKNLQVPILDSAQPSPSASGKNQDPGSVPR